MRIPSVSQWSCPHKKKSRIERAIMDAISIAGKPEEIQRVSIFHKSEMRVRQGTYEKLYATSSKSLAIEPSNLSLLG